MDGAHGMYVSSPSLKKFGPNAEWSSFKNRVKGGSGAAGATVLDKIRLRTHVLHCSVPLS